MYGSITEHKEILPENLDFKEVLTHNSKYLDKLRGKFMVNLSIPGSI